MFLNIVKDNKIIQRKEHIDYELISSEIWVLIVNLYGGGPLIYLEQYLQKVEMEKKRQLTNS